MVWDIFCRVIDNFGDVGVCWRLAAELGRRGQTVRLWMDDSTALAWMAPGGAPGVQLMHWTDRAPDHVPGHLPDRAPDLACNLAPDPACEPAPGAVVIEAFGCAPPEHFVARMAAAQPRPVWINLEYLSAEPYVARSHGLASPQFSGPGAGLTKWFFYPGFTAATGGLLQCRADPSGAEARAWVAAQGWAAAPGEQALTVFCYDNPALPALLHALAPQPTLLRLPPGPARLQLRALQQASALPPGLRLIDLPYLPQPDFDRLLAAADLNLVRGEDSFVRAQCAASAPFVWQIYPQHDGAHGAKLEAFLDLYLASQPAALASAVRAVFRAFNGLASLPAVLPEQTAWRSAHARWRHSLQAQTDLCSQLLAFVDRKRV